MFLDNFILIAQQVLVLFVLISVGFACGKFGVITEHASKKMTDIVLYIVTPCVMVNAFQREFTHELLGNVFIAAGVAVLILAGSILIARLVFHDKDMARRKVLQFALIFSNCGFMSLPLQKARRPVLRFDFCRGVQRFLLDIRSGGYERRYQAAFA